MALKYTWGGIVRGTAAEKATIPATVPLNTLFVETDTDKLYRYAGSSVWNELTSSGAGDTTSVYTWIVYKTGSTYKAKNGITGLTPYSDTNFKTGIWDNIKGNPAAKNHIHFLDGIYEVPSGSTLDLGVTNTDFHMSGESMFGVVIKPLGNNGVLDSINGRRQTFENFTIYTDLGTGYTSDAFRLTANANGVEHVTVKNVKIRQDAGTPTITNTTGRGFVLVATGSGANFNTNNFSYMNVQGFLNAITLTSTAISGFVWANEQHFHRIISQHSQAFFMGGLPASGDHMWGWHFKDCAFQTTAVTGTTQHMFILDPSSNPSKVYGWEIDNCVMWDPANNTHKFLKANTNCRILIKGGGAYPSSTSDSLGDQWMGGTGFNVGTGTWNTGAYVERVSPTAIQRGVTTVANGGTIAHRLLAAPKYVQLTPSVSGTAAQCTAKAASTFTVALSGVTTTQAINWEAREYI